MTQQERPDEPRGVLARERARIAALTPEERQAEHDRLARLAANMKPPIKPRRPRS